MQFGQKLSLPFPSFACYMCIQWGERRLSDTSGCGIQKSSCPNFISPGICHQGKVGRPLYTLDGQLIPSKSPGLAYMASLTAVLGSSLLYSYLTVMTNQCPIVLVPCGSPYVTNVVEVFFLCGQIYYVDKFTMYL